MLRATEGQLLNADELIPKFPISQTEFETGLSVLAPPHTLQENKPYTLYDDSNESYFASNAVLLKIQKDPFGFFEVEYSTVNTSGHLLPQRAVLDSNGFILDEDTDRVSIFGFPFVELGTMMLQDHANI